MLLKASLFRTVKELLKLLKNSRTLTPLTNPQFDRLHSLMCDVIASQSPPWSAVACITNPLTSVSRFTNPLMICKREGKSFSFIFFLLFCWNDKQTELPPTITFMCDIPCLSHGHFHVKFSLRRWKGQKGWNSFARRIPLSLFFSTTRRINWHQRDERECLLALNNRT